MADKIESFIKKKDYLVCVDSDGCAMDTMDIKHIRCFGPCMVEEWGLQQWQDEILARWNEINLYTMTRGINRFKGLAMALREIDAQYIKVEGIDDLLKWVEESPQLSNDAIEKAYEETGNPIFAKGLAWSRAVNTSINELPEELKRPFDGVKEALAMAHERADIAIVSSANLSAVLEEWETYELLPHTDIVLAQDSGSKAHCIGELLKKGYAPDHILMCGDAPGDLDAAKQNGVFYYPILVRKEAMSWERFQTEAFDKLTSNQYAGDYQEKLIQEFKENLGGQ